MVMVGGQNERIMAVNSMPSPLSSLRFFAHPLSLADSALMMVAADPDRRAPTAAA